MGNIINAYGHLHFEKSFIDKYQKILINHWIPEIANINRTNNGINEFQTTDNTTYDLTNLPFIGLGRGDFITYIGKIFEPNFASDHGNTVLAAVGLLLIQEYQPVVTFDYYAYDADGRQLSKVTGQLYYSRDQHGHYHVKPNWDSQELACTDRQLVTLDFEEGLSAATQRDEIADILNENISLTDDQLGAVIEGIDKDPTMQGYVCYNRFDDIDALVDPFI